MKRSPFLDVAIALFAMGTLCDGFGLLLLLIAYQSVQGMNLFTAAGQVQSAWNILLMAALAFLGGNTIKGAGLFCFAAGHH